LKTIPLILALMLAAPLAAQSVAPKVRLTAQGLELSVKADGTPPLAYLWRVGVTVKVPVAGGHLPVLLIKPPYGPRVGLYDCVVSNSAGSVTTASVRIATTAQADAPAVTLTFKEAKH
jgi:predicted dienelactone hydrolase